MNKRKTLSWKLGWIAILGLGLGGGLLHQSRPDWLQLRLGQGSSMGWRRSPTALPNPDGPTLETLRLLGNPLQGYSLFGNASFQEALQEAGIQLDYTANLGSTQRLMAFNRGEAELLVIPLDQWLSQNPQGKIVALLSRTVGRDAVVLNTPEYPQLRSLLDLDRLVRQLPPQELAIALEEDSPGEYFTLILEQKFANFNLADLRMLKVPDAATAWERLRDPQAKVALAVLSEPLVTQARQQGYTVVFSSRDTPRALLNVLVASNRAIATQPALIARFLEIYYRRIDTSVRDHSQLQTQIARDANLSLASAVTLLQHLKFFTALEAKTWMADSTLTQQLQRITNRLHRAGRLQQRPRELSALFTPELLTRAVDNTQTLITLVEADQPELAAQLAGKPQAGVRPGLPQLAKAQAIGQLRLPQAIQFEDGSTQLSAASQQTLQELARELADLNPETVAVQAIGHASATGNFRLNQQLSQQRAEGVINYLRQRGLEQALLAVGKGFEDLLPGLAASDPRQQRVEIQLLRLD